MKKSFKNTIDAKFSGITFKNKIVTDQQKVENKLYQKMNKHKFKYSNKIENDVLTIKKLIEDLKQNESINLITKKFDSPNIIKAILKDVKNLYISTFSITPAGINSLVEITNGGQINECVILLSSLHTSKWLFTSKAYQILNGKVQIRLCANHSKFICIEHKTGYLNFVGSMNFTNNPRFENITIDKNKENFIFYRNFIKTVNAETL